MRLEGTKTRHRYPVGILPPPPELILCLLLLSGCADHAIAPLAEEHPSRGCVDCHSSSSRLLASLPSATEPPSEQDHCENCSGDLPALSPVEKVLVSGVFFETVHAALACTECHGGAGNATDREAAHAGMTSDPSRAAEPVCARCHAGITGAYPASRHAALSGISAGIARREGGFEPSDAAAAMIAGRFSECRASCGECHVSRPRRTGGGLLRGHVFDRAPDDAFTCGGCHGDVVFAEYHGLDEGNAPDVHFEAGMDCLSCHSGGEIHGEGGGSVRSCYDCHPAVAYDQTRVEHPAHIANVACQVCHAQSYRECYGCHVGLEESGLAFPPRHGFRVGRNAAPTAARPWEFVPVRHAPVTPESFAEWGVVLDAFADEPTWQPTFPHNLRRTTAQTAMCETCHGVEGLFLTESFEDSLLEQGEIVAAELDANREVTVESLP
jgi:hypothetical protein